MTSELKVDKITPASGTNTQIGEAGDTTNLSAGTVTLPTSIITGQSAKTSLADADKFLISDSAASGAFKSVEKQYLPSGTLVQTGSSFSESDAGTSVLVQSCFSTTYENYLIVLKMLPGVNTANFQMRTLNGSSNFESSYEYASRYFDNAGSSSSDTSTGGSAFILADSVSSREYDGGVNYHIWCYLDRDDTNSGAFQFHGQGRFTHSNSSGLIHASYVAGHIADIENNKNTDGIKFYFGSGTVAEHNIKVYGYNGSAS